MCWFLQAPKSKNLWLNKSRYVKPYHLCKYTGQRRPWVRGDYVIYNCQRRAHVKTRQYNSLKNVKFMLNIKWMIWKYGVTSWKMFLWMTDDIINRSVIVQRLNDNYICCVIFTSVYWRFCPIFYRNVISFVNSTYVGCPTYMSQDLGVLHALWCCLRILYPWVASFDNLSG